MLIELSNNTKLAVIGDIHEQEDHFDEMIAKISPSSDRLVVSLGDVYDKGPGPHVAESITRKMMEFQKNGCLYAVRGNHEAKNIHKNRKSLTNELQWWRQQPLSLTFGFPNGSRITCLHGGVTPHATWESITSHSEVLYVRNVDEEGRMIRLKWIEEDGVKKLVEEKPNGRCWHDLYDGRLGYIVSGHQIQEDGVAKFYNHSCNLDSGCYMTGILTCQIFSQSGREEMITIKKEPI